MIGITLSPEQIKAAPPETRRWIEQEIASALELLAKGEQGLERPNAHQLAACSLEDALQIFELITGDYLACQVLFELGRGAETNGSADPFYALEIGEILAHTRLGSSEQLLRYFGLINEALQRVRHDPDARMFAFDRNGRCYIHEDTHRSISRLWRDFVAAQVQRLPDAGTADRQDQAAPSSDLFPAAR
jgi:hypothetical protein